MELIGRNKQIASFQEAFNSSESKLIAVYGRRRVGKTFMIRKHFEKHIQFEVTGLYESELPDQLQNFTKSLIKHGHTVAAISKPTTWMEAFSLLEMYLDTLKGKKKKVIFIDEMPWFDTPRSKFMPAFENFWNTYCTKRNDLLVVLSGSAASWMIKKVVHNKGGLHNRLFDKINLMPFSLYETEKFLKYKGIRWSRYDILQLYMTTGGVPYYLDLVRKGESVAQFVDRTCFDPQGSLYHEYNELYSSLFKNYETHQKIVSTLEKVKMGMTRSELSKKSGLPSGGTLSKMLDELEKSGFITTIIPYTANKNGGYYKLIDNFTLFYFKFMVSNNKRINTNWNSHANTQSWKSWSGFAFERLCFAHTAEIISALRLDVVQPETSTWQTKDETRGAQIDMTIKRTDRVVHACEMKFSKSEFTIDKTYAAQLRNKVDLFSNIKQNKRHNVFLTMITTFGTTNNEYYKELVQNQVVMDDLFINIER